MSEWGPDWRGFMRRHWGAVVLFVVAGALALTGAIYVFLWFVSNAQSSGMVPSTLGQWSMANVLTFIVYSIFWELLLVGIPVAMFGVGVWLWWRRLPDDEKRGFSTRTSRSTRGSGGLGIFFFIAFCIKIYIDGKWHVALASFTVDYVVGSMVTILEWTLVIFGIPAAIALIWWISRK